MRQIFKSRKAQKFFLTGRQGKQLPQTLATPRKRKFFCDASETSCVSIM